MKVRSMIWQAVVILGLGAASISGCSAPSSDTGPAEEPNVGPGGPAGGAKANFPPAAGPAEGKAKSGTPAAKTPTGK